MITHNGTEIPLFSKYWDSSDRDTIWAGWSELINGSSISASSWVVPAGWTNHSEELNQTVLDEDGSSHTNCNGVEVSIDDAEAGDYRFTNTCTFADGRVLERSVTVIVKEL